MAVAMEDARQSLQALVDRLPSDWAPLLLRGLRDRNAGLFSAALSPSTDSGRAPSQRIPLVRTLR